MKVKISTYRNHWLSPYIILEKVLFWKDWDNIDYDTPWVEKWNNRLEPICTVLMKTLDTIHPRKIKVKIDPWDAWNADHTLALIILPVLKEIREHKQGAPFVDDEDVPDELKSINAKPKENEWDTDSNHFARWDWVMDQMIWSFEQIIDENWEDQFHTGNIDFALEKDETTGLYTMVKGPNDTHKFDIEGYKAYSARIDNGLKLFGIYYRSLWT